MSQQSEERVPESTPATGDGPPGARILHMKSTHYDLQRAIQQRAQESVEREAQLDREERRPKPLKWLIIFAIACVPIALTLFMVDGFLRAFHQYLYTTTQQQQQQQQQQAEQAEADAQLPADTNLQGQPGVVMLQPLNPQETATPEQDASKGPTSDSAATPEK
jgi:hypothetical protein